jgi:hypothetical protein
MTDRNQTPNLTPEGKLTAEGYARLVMREPTKPTLKPEALASALFEFLEWASTDERYRLCTELKDLSNNACPQGTLAKVAFLSEALNWLAEGGVRQSDHEWEDAEERMANAPRSRASDHRPDGDDEYEEAKEDRDNARALCRLLLKHQKRAKATFEDIRSQVPIE